MSVEFGAIVESCTYVGSQCMRVLRRLTQPTSMQEAKKERRSRLENVQQAW
jgi:hypothetical protein